MWPLPAFFYFSKTSPAISTSGGCLAQRTFALCKNWISKFVDFFRDIAPPVVPSIAALRLGTTGGYISICSIESILIEYTTRLSLAFSLKCEFILIITNGAILPASSATLLLERLFDNRIKCVKYLVF